MRAAAGVGTRVGPLQRLLCQRAGRGAVVQRPLQLGRVGQHRRPARVGREGLHQALRGGHLLALQRAAGRGVGGIDQAAAGQQGAVGGVGAARVVGVAVGRGVVRGHGVGVAPGVEQQLGQQEAAFALAAIGAMLQRQAVGALRGVHLGRGTGLLRLRVVVAGERVHLRQPLGLRSHALGAAGRLGASPIAVRRVGLHEVLPGLQRQRGKARRVEDLHHALPRHGRAG